MTDRTHRDLTAADIARIAGTYHAWRGDTTADGLHPSSSNRRLPIPQPFSNVPGFCKSATLDDIRTHGYVLTPGRYVGVAEAVEDDEPFAEKMERLTTLLREQSAESTRLERIIWSNLEQLGYE
jgi:type I restriction enzyme M protein